VKKIRSMVEHLKVVTAFRMPFKSYRGGRYRTLGTPPDGAFDRHCGDACGSIPGAESDRQPGLITVASGSNPATVSTPVRRGSDLSWDVFEIARVVKMRK
jgi:hypothetical protein